MGAPAMLSSTQFFMGASEFVLHSVLFRPDQNGTLEPVTLRSMEVPLSTSVAARRGVGKVPSVKLLNPPPMTPP